YGDFEFTFEIKEWLTFTDENGEKLPCNFAISWGRPAAEADYAAGGGVAFLAYSICIGPNFPLEFSSNSKCRQQYS
ncbi:MAG: hypothetical protein IKD28_05485, partial [Clostridia bacterium]|nr:hypothetical protein [Clostridia bacterium]